MQLRGGARDVAARVNDVRGVPAELLAERDRHGVLQVGAAGFQNVRELGALGRKAAGQAAGGREQARHHAMIARRVAVGIHVVGRLSHVDVIVRVHARVLAARAAEDLRRAVGEDLVRVHVVRGAGAGLIDVDDELIAQLPGEHVVGRTDDGGGDLRRQPSERGVGLGGGLLDLDRGDDELGRRGRPLIGKFSTARCVCAP